MRKPFQRIRPLPEMPPPKEKVYELLEPDEIILGSIKRKAGIPGIYFLIDGLRIVYVGQSMNIHARIYQHRIERKKQFTSYFLLPCQPEELTPLESLYIQRYRPKYNLLPRWDRSGVKPIAFIQSDRVVGGEVER